MLRIAAIVIAILALCGHPAVAQQTSRRVDFSLDIRPIFAKHCFACHGPDHAAREAGLRLDTQDGASKVDSKKAAIVPGDSSASELFRRISTRNDDQRMPPIDAGDAVSLRELELIRRWIDDGAKWQQHWAFVPPQRGQIPRAHDKWTVLNPIDNFVHARLEEEGLQPSSFADKPTLIRRVTLDLTGVPPTPEEVDEFVHDDSPDAYEELIDRLLASPHYGERLSIPWLDAARYADTHGYLFDTERSMWRWRDWVIDAFNRNQPFDEFTIEQLAGDLLPNATLSQKIATGFNRNHLINNEAGAIPNEYLVENIVDRVNTTATVWMGVSLSCCQCHDHKYDPFSQKEYYQLYAFFNTIPELGLDGLNTNARPLMKAPTVLDRNNLAEVQRRTSSAELRLDALASQIEAGQGKWEASYARPEQVPKEGRLAHWPLDKTPDDFVRQSFGKNLPKPQTVFEAAPASYAAGVLGEAASLAGLGYVNAGDRFNFTANDTFSFTAWVHLTTKNGRQSIVSRMQNNKKLFRGYTLQLFAGMPSFFLVNQFPEKLMQVQGHTSLEPDRWYHLAVTYDGSGKAAGVQLYVDGELQRPTIVIDKLTGPITTNRDFWIGNGHPAAKLKGLVDDVHVFGRVLSQEEVSRLPGLSIQSLLAIDANRRNDEQARRVREFYLSNHAPTKWREPYQALTKLREELVRRERALPTVMVMKEQESPRETRLLVRGAYNNPGEKVTANTPDVLPPLDPQLPKNRLGLARWLVDPNHPLTARTTVNRFWQMYFGTGILKTSEDFGVRGERPSHPELLDWLAREFVASGWDVKAFQRLIVTSATYRQSSKAAPELLHRDPENRLLARGPRVRLTAEMIRDQALFASGLLASTIGGPSVKPYQPDGLWREVAFDFSGANLTAQIYQPEAGANLYRRSMYTFWKRTAPPPTMLLFDAPDRERCVVRRERTNTPLQALALMNDPTYVEAARRLAERVMRETDSGPDRIRAAFRLVTARYPKQMELSALLALLERRRAAFAMNVDQADALLAVGESTFDASLPRAELAAYTMVANVILNLNESIIKD